MPTAKLPKLLALTLLLLPVVSSNAFAQSSAPAMRPNRTENPDQYYRGASTMNGKSVVVPVGTTWEGRIDQTISSAHSHTGQRFNVTMSSPVLLNGTDVIVPAGSQIIGEVVEAIPASHVPIAKYQDKHLIRGKLQVSLSGLRTPDGVTYPLVGALAGEVPGKQAYLNRTHAPMGTSVGYVGTEAQFASMDPSLGHGRTAREHSSRKVVGKNEFLKDSIWGAGDDGFDRDKGKIRSLFLKGRDYYVFEGSPLTIRLEAPFKIGISSPGMGVPITPVSDAPVEETLPPPTRNRGGGAGFDGGGAPPATASGGGYRNQGAPSAPSQGAIPADSF